MKDEPSNLTCIVIGLMCLIWSAVQLIRKPRKVETPEATGNA